MMEDTEIVIQISLNRQDFCLARLATSEIFRDLFV
jgi:hypothetical protein